MRTRRQLLIAGLPAGAVALNSACRALSEQGPNSDARLRRALRRGAQYLWSRQSPDGGWHSWTYGLLASGQSLTPFVLRALLADVQTLVRPERQALNRAFEFIAAHTDRAGAVGRMDPVAIDYPNYATALAIRSNNLGQPAGWPEAISRMTEYLRSQQLTDDLGWKTQDPAYGAWGVGGEPRRAPHAGHVDLSMTRHVIEGLRAAGVGPSDPALRSARVFVERCQNFSRQSAAGLDGGFYFSTVVLDANKAGEECGLFRSYSTATADGLLCLLALGYPPSHARVVAARRWLGANLNPDRAAGFEGAAYHRWPRGLRFYDAAAATAALNAAGRPAPASEPAQLQILKLAASLLAEQQADGSWSNSENLVKEDDPLIATGFAISALASAAG